MELKEIEKQIQLLFGCNSRDAGIVTILVEQYGKEQYNQALEDTIVNAEIIYGEGILPFLNKQSIRKLKKH